VKRAARSFSPPVFHHPSATCLGPSPLFRHHIRTNRLAQRSLLVVRQSLGVAPGQSSGV
jgi:hypothetical protein